MAAEILRADEKLLSALEVGERHRRDKEKLLDGHGELAVELGRALFRIRRLEEDKMILANKLNEAEVKLAMQDRRK